MLALLMPGQGSQTPGMLEPWLNDETRQELSKWSLQIDLDLERLGTSASSDEIKDTANAQPLIVATSLISAKLLAITNFKIVAGHSVGEIAAVALSGVLSETQALQLVRARGLAMAKAASRSNTGMAAVLGGEKNIIIERLKEIQLYAANINSQGQIIASGKLSKINELIRNPIEKTKVIKLDVSGAFHTPYMQNAKDKFETEMKNQKFQDSNLKLLSNYDGKLISNSQDLKSKITNQLTNSVRWDLCQETMMNSEVTGLLEVAPGGVLSGIAKKAMNQVEIMTIKTPEDIENANACIIKHNR